MEFLQIIEGHSTKFDEMMANEAEWRKATEGKRTLKRSVVARDREDPTRYVILAFFDDYDSAMVNSNLPETTAFGEKQRALTDGPTVFSNLDVIEFNRD